MQEKHEWTSAEAKVHFSVLIDSARQEPQLIFRYGKPVAVLVDSELFYRQLAPHVDQMKYFLREIQEINRTTDEGDLEIMPRTDRIDIDEICE